MEQNQDTFDFLSANILLIGVIVLAFIGYLIMLIRKRSKQGFLHSRREKKEQ